MSLDVINGAFEGAAALSILNHCRVVHRQKSATGVSVLSTLFFFIWGLWNMYYYPALGQSFSYYAGVAVAASNALWIGLILKYRKVKANTWPKVSHF